MPDTPKIRVGSRNSALARVQVDEIELLLKQAGTMAILERKTYLTRGDKDQVSSLISNPADNFFTDTLDQALLEGAIDVAIHSAKDLPQSLPEGLTLFALTRSPDDTDAFVGKTSFDRMPSGAQIATSSLLRQEQLRLLRPDLKIVDIRGTIEERLHKLEHGNCDGLIVATVALKRLKLERHIQNIMPWETAPTQGQLAVVGRSQGSQDAALKELFSKIDVRTTYGRVLLVGAGPGDPELITVKGLQVLAAADCVVYDYLVPLQLLEYAKNAEKIYAGKRKGTQTMPQYELNKLLRKKALAGKTVVRLKGGDPLVFGRGADEIDYLRRYYIDVEIIPGISSAVGIPSRLGVPLTARDISSSVAFVSGYRKGEGNAELLEIPSTDTLIFLMGLTKLDHIVRSLELAGWGRDTPMMIISKGTWPEEKIVRATIATIQEKVRAQTIDPPVLIIVGKTLQFYQAPTAGVRPRILCTGTNPQPYEKLGKIILFPTIEIVPAQLDVTIQKTLLTNLAHYDIILFTSRFGVRYFWELLTQRPDVQAQVRVKPFAVIGQITAREIIEYRVRKLLIAQRETSEGLLEELRTDFNLRGKKILFPRSSLPNPYLKERLIGEGAQVDELTIYENIKPPKRTLPQTWIDAILFTSPSTVRNFLEDYNAIPEHWRILSRGSLTSACLKEKGYTTFQELDQCLYEE